MTGGGSGSTGGMTLALGALALGALALGALALGALALGALALGALALGAPALGAQFTPVRLGQFDPVLLGRGADPLPGLVPLGVAHPFDLVEAGHRVPDVLGVDERFLALFREGKVGVAQRVFFGRPHGGRPGGFRRSHAYALPPESPDDTPQLTLALGAATMPPSGPPARGRQKGARVTVRYGARTPEQLRSREVEKTSVGAWSTVLVALFETDPDALASVLPKPLEPSSRPLAKATFATVDIPGLATFGAGSFSVQCRHQDTVGYYCLVMPMSTEQSVIGGRETFGEPKKIGQVAVDVEGDAVRGTHDPDGRHLRRIHRPGHRGPARPRARDPDRLLLQGPPRPRRQGPRRRPQPSSTAPGTRRSAG